MAFFEVDSDRVISTAQAAARSAGILSGEVDALMRHLQALNDCWKGGAAQDFQAVVSEWEGVQRTVHQSLNNIQEALHLAGSQYQDVEDANRKMFSRS